MNQQTLHLQPIKINAKKEDLVNPIWLFNAIPWVNQTGQYAEIRFEEKHTWFYYNMDDKIVKFKFDKVDVNAIHSFSGNQYTFIFKKNDNTMVYNTTDNLLFNHSKKELIKNLVSHKESQIKLLETQINELKKNIETLKNLN